MKSSNRWLEQPKEIWNKIFEHLDAPDLLRVSEVCKRWNNIAKSNNLWMSLFEQDYSNIKFLIKSKKEMTMYKSKDIRWVDVYKFTYTKKLQNARANLDGIGKPVETSIMKFPFAALSNLLINIDH